MTDYLENITTIAYNFSRSQNPYGPFNHTGIAISATIIFIFLIVGLFGNGLTIAVILSCKTLRSNVFMRFILSLCFSDLISALISWLFLYRRTWGFNEFSPLPDVLCKFYWAADLMTSFVTALHILSFAVLRLISITFPHKFKKINSVHEQIWIGLIWLICFLCGFIPAWFLFGVGHPDRNSNLPNARWPACTALIERFDDYVLFQKTAYPIFLYAPTVGIIFMCILTIVLVKKKPINIQKTIKGARKQGKEQQAAVQLILIIISFLIGYLPFTAYEFWGVQDFPNERYYHVADYWFGMIEYLFLRFSECLNPLFYNLGSSKMRSHTEKFLKQYAFCSLLRKKDTTIDLTSHPRLHSDKRQT